MSVITPLDTSTAGEPGSHQPGPGTPHRVQAGLLDPKMLWTSLPDAFAKLNPATLWKNPVMFIVEIGAVFTTVIAIAQPSVFAWLIVFWLWLTVLFANVAEAVAEGRGKAQADALRRAKTDTVARRLVDRTALGGAEEAVPAPQLQQGDRVVCEAGDIIPGDGDVIEGIASVDESAITGESAPVIRESGGDRSSVTGGTKVLSDRIVVEITQKPGESFIDRMIALVEGASRQKTPNEIALNILLASLTIIFLLATVTLQPLAIFSKTIQPGLPNTSALNNNGITGIVHGVAAGLPDPDHDRRAAVGDRHRGHGPSGAAQRAGDERSCRRGGRRREHAAAGQDRHHHAGQPAGQRLHPDRRRTRRRAGRCGATVVAWPTRRPRAGRSSCLPRPSTVCASGRRAS